MCRKKALQRRAREEGGLYGDAQALVTVLCNVCAPHWPPLFRQVHTMVVEMANWV